MSCSRACTTSLRSRCRQQSIASDRQGRVQGVPRDMPPGVLRRMWITVGGCGVPLLGRYDSLLLVRSEHQSMAFDHRCTAAYFSAHCASFGAGGLRVIFSGTTARIGEGRTGGQALLELTHSCQSSAPCRGRSIAPSAKPSHDASEGVRVQIVSAVGAGSRKFDDDQGAPGV